MSPGAADGAHRHPADCEAAFTAAPLHSATTRKNRRNDPDRLILRKYDLIRGARAVTFARNADVAKKSKIVGRRRPPSPVAHRVDRSASDPHRALPKRSTAQQPFARQPCDASPVWLRNRGIDGRPRGTSSGTWAPVWSANHDGHLPGVRKASW